MAFIGNTNTTQAFTPAVDFFSGNASTTAFTLSRPVASVAQVQAVISNVPQDPGSAYTVSGSTITFTSAPPSGTNNIYVYYTSPITQVIAPGQGTVGTASLSASLAVPAAQLTGTQTIPKATLPTGSVLQVVQGIKTDTFVTSATVTDTAVTGLTVSITPTSSSSKILVFCNLGIAAENAQGGAAKLTRTISATTTQLSLADTAGSRSRGSFAGSGYRGSAYNYLLMLWHQSLTFLDSPATTSAITYGVQVSSISVGTYINRTGTDSDSADMYRGVSYITVMEIAA